MKFIKSFRHAARGIISVSKTEPNFRRQIFGLFLVIGLGLFFDISQSEWLFIILAGILVLVSEIINTAFEKTLDVFHPEIDARVGRVKDMLAGAVLLAAFFAGLIGLVIFWPYVIYWF